MVTGQALLLGIPAGAALMLLAPPWWVFGLAVAILLFPKPSWRWRVMVVVGLAAGCLRIQLLPPPLATPEGPAVISGQLRDVRETWSKTRYLVDEARLSDDTALGTVWTTVRSAEAEANRAITSRCRAC